MPDNNTQNHWIIITNPKAGKQMFSKRFFLDAELDNSPIPHTFLETEFAGHAITLAQEYANKGYTHFLIWGGDGSINEVINGLFHSNVEDKSKFTIAIVPRGTGNDWARFWKLNKYKYKEAWEIFQNGKSRFIDIGKVAIFTDEKPTYRYFINSIGFGLDAEIAELTLKLKRYLGSHTFLYTLALLLAVFRYKSIDSFLQINGQKQHLPLFTMNIANGPFSGGGIKQNPSAVPFDGLFDMMYVEKPTLRQILSVLPHIFDGKIAQNGIIKTAQTQKVIFESEKDFLIETDGMVFEDLKKCEVEIIPGAIQMIVSEDFI